ncbi:heptaprenyl diphosphate synthase component II [Ammoniphilus resinae]|uniref:Heptaprenyl diphosphate synthase n=1 Tax=Ammoniphilus resinae TaxID=861532 RepID=A0ABS4GT38_9BACL|nr:heptaprenyl diphosphate synthase component II [Ammoniphilus resinae]MBP1933453.1 heptaprenyl diphosphate synthase [Ammoniphilus resinae]
MKLAEIYLQMRSDMNFIEKELEKSITTKHGLLREAASHLMKAGGKRIRPVFVLLAGKLGTYDLERLKNVAVALELIHMATLVHDDVIDDAEKRRGQLTVKAKWDNRIAMYTGDYILAEGLRTVTELGMPRIHKILSKAIVQVCVGEVEQIRDFHNWNQNLRRYLHRIKRKTALLIAISCQLGAIAAGATEQVVRAMYNYGYHVGMAFQITDDILDFVGDEKKLGKPSGNDLRQGNITLPAIYCYHDVKSAEQLQYLLRSENHGMDKAIEYIRQSDGIHYAQCLADKYLKKALSWLDDLPDTSSRATLYDLANFIGKRQY